MATGEARAMLDALMGQDRNACIPNISRAGLDEATNESIKFHQQQSKRKKSCYDRDVCPYYTAWGVDLYDLFTNTKSDLGARPEPFKVVCDDDAHDEFMKLSRDEQERLGYERMLHQKLRSLVQQCNRIVSRNKEKLRQEIARNAKQTGGSASMKVDPAQNLSQDQLQICAEMMVKVEDLEKEIDVVTEKLLTFEKNEKESHSANSGTNGEIKKLPTKDKMATKTELIESVMKKVLESEMLKEQVAAAKRSLYYIRGDIQTDKTVCEVSGNFMSSRDADERIAAHFAGKQYVGWKMVRDKLKKLDEKYRDMPPPVRGGGWGSGPPPPRSNRDDRSSGRRFGESRRGRSDDRWQGGGYNDRGPPPRYDDRRRGGGGYNDRGGSGGYGRDRDRRRW